MESEPDAEEGLYDIIFRSLKPFVFCACKYCQGIEKRPQLNFLFISQLSQMTQLNLLYALHIMQSDWQMYKELASSAKAMGIKNAPKEKNGLVKVVAEAL